MNPPKKSPTKAAATKAETDRPGSTPEDSGPGLRRRAEITLQGKISHSPEPREELAPDAMRRILHELRVHRIELEIQNEELRRAKLELEASQARYFDLYDLAPMGYSTVNARGLIIEANLTLAILLGAGRGALTLKPFSRFVAKEDADRFSLVHRRMLAKPAVGADDKAPSAPAGHDGELQTCALRMVRSDGSRFWAQVTLATTLGEDGVPNLRVALTDISAIKQTEEFLRVSDLALKAVSQGVTICSPDALIVSTNDASVAITGYSREEVLGRSFRFLQGPLSDPQVVEAIRTAVHSRTHFNGEILNYRKDGRTFWNELSIAPIFDDAGVLTHYIGITRDITERKTAANDLREKEERLALATRHNGVGIWDWNLITQEMIWDDSMYALYGIRREDFSGSEEAWRAALHPDDLERGDQEIREALSGLRPFETEFRVVWPNGEIRHIKAAAKVFRNERGAPVRMLGTNVDITALKLGEADRHQSEARLRTLFEYSPYGIWLEDFSAVRARFDQLRSAGVTDFRAHFAAHPDEVEQCGGLVEVRDVNEQSCRIMGAANKAELITRLPSYFTAASLEVFREELITLAEGGTVFTGEIPLVLPNGEKIICSLQVVVVPGAEQTLSQVMLAFSDITARKQGEKDRQQLEQKMWAVQKLESLGVLAGGVAHDFNNILTGILGNASLASSELPAGAPLQPYLQEIMGGSLRAAELCKQMLAFSGRGHFVVQTQDLNQLVMETSRLLKLSISKKQVLHFELDPTPVLTDADAAQVRQVIMNLVSNAAEAIGDAAGSITLRTGRAELGPAGLEATILGQARAGGRYAYLEVTDSGGGMSPEVQARIFEPFFTTKFTGRGLGLAAVHGIMRGHQGEIEIRSAPGAGTTFKVFFPGATADTEQPFGAIRGAPPEQRGRACVLVVEDEESVRKTVALMLELKGFEVVTANDGREAVAAYRAEPDRFGMVLMDLSMPQLDGVEAFTEMRGIREKVQVVLMSGYDAKEIRLRFAEDRPVDFLQKPFELEGLLKVVRGVLGRVAEPV